MVVQAQPPHCFAAEQHLVAGLWRAFNGPHEDAYAYGMRRLAAAQAILPDAALLYDQRCAAVYGAICQLAADGYPVDLVTIREELRREQPDLHLGASDLVDMLGIAEHAAHVEYHAELIRGRAEQRQVLEAGRRIIAAAANGGPTLATDARLLLDSALADAPAVGARWVDGATAVDDCVNHYETPAEPFRFGTPERPHPLDNAMACMRADEPWLGVLVGAPGSYKSALALDLARRLVEREPVYYVGFEEAATFRLKRLVARAAQRSLYDTTFAGTECPGALRAVQAQLRAQLANLRLCCGHALTVGGLRRLLWGQRTGAPLTVVIDALQDIGLDGEEQDRRREMDRIMLELHDLKAALPARILLLSHAARSGTGQGYRGGISAAKESSGIEYKTDLLLTMRTEQVDPVPGLVDEAPLVRLTIGVHKHRSGPLGDHNIAIRPDRGVFDCWGTGHQQRYDAAKEAK